MKTLIPISLAFALAACTAEVSTDVETNADASAKASPLESPWLTEAPSGAVEVAALRSLESDADVVVRGDVRDHSTIPGKAVLMVYDHALDSCDEMGDDDHCQTPWDFCCVDDDDIAKASVLVEFRKDGSIMDGDLKGFHGLDYLSDVVVTGKLKLDDAGNATIVAQGLHVE